MGSHVWQKRDVWGRPRGSSSVARGFWWPRINICLLSRINSIIYFRKLWSHLIIITTLFLPPFFSSKNCCSQSHGRAIRKSRTWLPVDSRKLSNPTYENLEENTERSYYFLTLSGDDNQRERTQKPCVPGISHEVATLNSFQLSGGKCWICRCLHCRLVSVSGWLCTH